jgi:hypothetical protein
MSLWKKNELSAARNHMLRTNALSPELPIYEEKIFELRFDEFLGARRKEREDKIRDFDSKKFLTVADLVDPFKI